MDRKLLRTLRTVLITLIALITVALTITVCMCIWISGAEVIANGILLCVEILLCVGFGIYILYECVHLGIQSVCKEDLPNWYVAPAFKIKLLLLCYAASLILFFAIVIIIGRMYGESTVMGSLGFVVEGSFDELILSKLGSCVGRLLYAIWGNN